jgi:hypothetical protein
MEIDVLPLSIWLSVPISFQDLAATLALCRFSLNVIAIATYESWLSYYPVAEEEEKISRRA